MHRKLFMLVAAFVCLPALAGPPVQGGAIPVPLPLFPPNNWWNIDVSAAPLDPNSANLIAFINQPYANQVRPLHPDWGGDVGDGTLYGFPYIIVDGSQPKQTVTFDFFDESDGVGVPFYPIPAEAITQYGWIEEGPPGNVDDRSVSDRHMLIVDSTNNYLYELYNVFYDGSSWLAGSGAFWDMNTNNTRPAGWTSADAAGLQILPGLVRYDEVYGPNEITHALRFTVRSTNGYVYPASHVAGSTAGALPMGARLRLKSTKDLSTFPADVQKIFRAFQKYGIIVADNGSDMYVSGSYDNRWDMGTMNTAFRALNASDFEVVQLGWKPPVSLVIGIPSTLTPGALTTFTVTARDANDNVATAYRGTVHFSSTDGAASFPPDYTFTAADSGMKSFPIGIALRTDGGQTVYATDIADTTITGSRNVTVGPFGAPTLVALASGTSSIGLSWNAITNAAQYEVYRQTPASALAHLLFTTATSITDSAGISGGNTYVYTVRAIDSLGHDSPFSAPDAATTIAFTDDPLVPGTTPVKAVHLTELRTAVASMRRTAGLAASTFTDPTLTNVPFKTVHIQELRTALNEARAALGLMALAYADPALAGGTTVVNSAHVRELRSGVK